MYTIFISGQETDQKIKQMLQELCGNAEQVYPQPETARRQSTSARCCISTPKGIYNIPYSDILFIESAQKKSIVHTTREVIALPVPLYRMREVLAGEGFVQTHRSFIIHLRKVSFVDKTKEPWTIYFFDSDLTAFVSRSYRKDLMDAVTPYLDCIAD